jgi:hypothetical protein
MSRQFGGTFTHFDTKFLNINVLNAALVLIRIWCPTFQIENPNSQGTCVWEACSYKTRQHWITKVRFVNRSPQLKALHY